MEVSTALRRIKRDFGDEYNVVILDQDIYDWMHDAELDIIRSTSDNDLSLSVPANKFPINIPNRVNIKRVSINGKALTYTTFTDIDLIGGSTDSISSTGTPAYWYFQGGQVGLQPNPNPNDTYSVVITYARTPGDMSVVAPYLHWQSFPTATQYATVESDDDWATKADINLTLLLSFDSFQSNFNIFTMGTTNNANTFHFNFDIEKQIAPNSWALNLRVCDRTSVIVHKLGIDVMPTLKVGELVKIRVTFTGATNTARLYKTDLVTEIESLLYESVMTPAPFNKNTQAPAKLFIGNLQDTNPPTGANSTTPLMNLYAAELRTNPDPTSQIAFLFYGDNDIGKLPAPQANFTSSSGHAVSTFGGLVIPGQNSFTVPEVYHEDIIKYCLAKAHDKNQNFRAAEAQMEQYDRRVSTRRNEAQAIEAPLYKIADPDDYDMVGY